MKYKIIITAGGTSEKIDNVRKITNSGTGKLGFTIANKFLENSKIDKIYYICSKKAYKPENEKVKIIEIESAKDLENKVKELLKTEKIDYFIHSMAVSDYTVDYVVTAEKLVTEIKKNSLNILKTISDYKDGIKENKISSKEENLIVKLKKTPKIISLIKNISPNTFLVGFKLLDNVKEKELINVAIELKEKNKCDIVIANDLNNIRKGNHKAFIIKDNDNYKIAYGKEEIALKLYKEIFNA